MASSDELDEISSAPVSKRKSRSGENLSQPLPKGHKKKSAGKPEKEEKMREKKAATRERLMKKIMAKQQKNMQPGECLKFIQVNIDDEIRNLDFYRETLNMLELSAVKHTTKSLLVPKTVSWTRLIEEDTIDDDNKLSTLIKKEDQKYLVVIWSWDEVVERVKNKRFVESVASVADLGGEMKLSLIIYGMEAYFEYHKRKNKKIESPLHEGIANLPKISREDFENDLIDIQLEGRCNVRLIEKSADMSLLIYQYTKAIAEIPYKLETNMRLHDQMDFYAAGDNKNTIKVDHDGHGLKKLWLKQLCMFNNSRLPIAEAICSVYPSPDELMDEYRIFSEEGGENLLKDVPIKRAVGPLTTVRKLGPELSRKTYIMFTSTNGEQILD